MNAPCDHGNNMGLHGRLVCVDCGFVLRQMTPEERAADPTFRTVVDLDAMESVRKVLRPKGPAEHPADRAAFEAWWLAFQDVAADFRWEAFKAGIGRGRARGARWQLINKVPRECVVQLLVRRGNELRVMPAEAIGSRSGTGLGWMVTVDWSGWTRLHSAWTPIGWQPLASSPNTAL